MPFRQRLRALIASRGLSQAELAKLAGLSQQAISRILVGNGDPQFSTVCALADALGVATDAFRSDRPAPPPDETSLRITVEAGDEVTGEFRELATLPVRIRLPKS